jgi:hypothetical protein
MIVRDEEGNEYRDEDEDEEAGDAFDGEEDDF